MMMTGTVLDILIYVFDHYMLEENPQVLERTDLARQLEGVGFPRRAVERALDWLTDLACFRDHPPVADTGAALRIYSESETLRLSSKCRGLLLTLESLGILSAQHREIIIDRLLALDSDELDSEQLKWVAMMVLSSQPGQERAFAQLADLGAAMHPRLAH
jgi:Smg protein